MTDPSGKGEERNKVCIKPGYNMDKEKGKVHGNASVCMLLISNPVRDSN